MILGLHGTLRKKILQLMEQLKMPKFQALFSLNVYDFWVLQGVALLPFTKKISAFGDLTMLNLFRPFFSLNI